jgi:hypothetical protein
MGSDASGSGRVEADQKEDDPMKRISLAGRMAIGATLLAVLVFPGQAAAALPSECVQVAGTVTCSYAPTGAEQQFAVPAGVTNLHVTALGGAGQDSILLGSTTQGGLGGLVSAGLPVIPGQSLYVEVGGPGSGATGGFNGGGDASYDGGGGGGASDVRACSMAAANCPGGGTRSTRGCWSRRVAAARADPARRPAARVATPAHPRRRVPRARA